MINKYQQRVWEILDSLFSSAKYTCSVMENLYFKEVIEMILFTILALTLILLVIFTIVTVAATGAVGIVLFGDVIVCIIFIVWIIKKIVCKKK